MCKEWHPDFLNQFILRFLERALLEPQLLHQTLFLVMLLMDIQFMGMPLTLLVQPWRSVGQPQSPALHWCLILPTTQQVTLQELAILTKPTVTLSPMELMDMSWYLTTTMSHTTMLAPKLQPSVASLHKNWCLKHFIKIIITSVVVLCSFNKFTYSADIFNFFFKHHKSCSKLIKRFSS